MPNSRRKYDEEFKKRAVRLSYSSERSIKATAESLGINANYLAYLNIAVSRGCQGDGSLGTIPARVIR